MLLLSLQVILCNEEEVDLWLNSEASEADILALMRPCNEDFIEWCVESILFHPHPLVHCMYECVCAYARVCLCVHGGCQVVVVSHDSWGWR